LTIIDKGKSSLKI